MLLFTFADAVHHTLDFAGSDASALALRAARIAVLDAYRELHAGHTWSYLYRNTRLVLQAPFQTGTVEYRQTGGIYERQVTLSGGTWPQWAKYGTLLINSTGGAGDNVAYDVEDRKSDTIVTLDSAMNPGIDVIPGKTIVLFRDTYQLPEDFQSSDEFQTYNQWHGITFIHPREWLYNRVRTNSARSGYPLLYTIVGDVDAMDRLALKVYPYPDTNYALDYVYNRRPRPLQIYEYKTGTLAVTANVVTITGTGTAWNSTMVGSIIRIQPVDTTLASGVTETGPYGFDRNAYYVHERRIARVNSATSLDLDSAIPETIAAGTRYVISDPVDVHLETMKGAFLRLCERQSSIARNTESKADYVALAAEAMIRARESDSRSTARRRVSPGAPAWGSYHLPLSSDIS